MGGCACPVWAWAVGVVVVWVVVMVPPASPCSCLLRHPQQHVCDSDFVVFARVRRLITTPNGNAAYKVKVKRLVKGSEKVELMLQKGLMYTPQGTCEAPLRNRTSYVITGNVVANRPTLTLCNFASPMRDLTPKMKKGFRLLYQSGCDCPIMSCHYWERCPKGSFFCPWETVREEEDCQGRQSVCLRGPSGSCDWLQGRLYRRCMKDLRQRSAHNSTGTIGIGGGRRTRPPLPQRTVITNKTPPFTTITNNNNSTPIAHRPSINAINPYRHNTQEGNRIYKGVPGFPRRRKPSRFWYKRRPMVRGRLRRPLRRRHHRRPGLTYLPKTTG